MSSIDILDAYWRDIQNIPPLTQEEEEGLYDRIHEGDEFALDDLVTANLRYIVAIARQFAQKGDVSMDDLISEGNMAMLFAARKWNPSHGIRFAQYASHDIRKAMQNALPQQGTMITLPKKALDSTGAPTSRYKSFRRFSTDAPVHPGQTNTLGDLLKAGRPTTDDAVIDSELSYQMLQVMQGLNQREQLVIRYFYGIATPDKMTMAEIGERMGLHRERIRQIRKTAERKMRRIIRKNTELDLKLEV